MSTEKKSLFPRNTTLLARQLSCYLIRTGLFAQDKPDHILQAARLAFVNQEHYHYTHVSMTSSWGNEPQKPYRMFYTKFGTEKNERLGRVEGDRYKIPSC